MKLEDAESLSKWLKNQKKIFQKMLSKNKDHKLFIGKYPSEFDKIAYELDKEIKQTRFEKKKEISMKYLVFKLKTYIKNL